MSVLDRLIPESHLLQVDGIDVPAPPEQTWERVRHGALAQSLPIRALFALRTIASRNDSEVSPTIAVDSLTSSAEHPGFQILIDDPPREVAVGAIGKVWRLSIP